MDWNRRNVLGSFRKGPPPELFLRSNNASELTVFHEMIHLEYWYLKKPKIHYVQEEIYVWEEIWKTKDMWTKKELYDSYIYVRELVENVNRKTGSKIKFELNLEMESLKYFY